MRKAIFIQLIFLLIIIGVVSANVPKNQTSQIILRDLTTSDPISGNVDVNYSLIDGTSVIWNESITTTLDEGIASNILGSITDLTYDLFLNNPFVKINIDDGQEMIYSLTTYPYAFIAQFALSVNHTNVTGLSDNYWNKAGNTGLTGTYSGSQQMVSSSSARFDSGYLDGADKLSLSANNRQWVYTDGSTIVGDYSSGQLHDTSGSNTALDWFLRRLIAGSGGDVIFDWSQAGTANFEDSDRIGSGDIKLNSDSNCYTIGASPADAKICFDGLNWYFKRVLGSGEEQHNGSTLYNFDNTVKAPNFNGTFNGEWNGSLWDKTGTIITAKPTTTKLDMGSADIDGADISVVNVFSGTVQAVTDITASGDMFTTNITVSDDANIGNIVTPAGTLTIDSGEGGISMGTLTVGNIDSTGDWETTGNISAENLHSTDDALIEDNLIVGGDITTTGNSSAENLHSTDDALIEDNLIVGGDILATGTYKYNNPTSPIVATGTNLGMHFAPNSVIQGGVGTTGASILQFISDAGGTATYGPILMTNGYYDGDANSYRQIRGGSTSVDTYGIVVNALSNRGITFNYADGNQGNDGAITMTDVVRINNEGLKMLGNAIVTGEAQTDMKLRSIDSAEFGGFSFDGWGFASENGANRQAYAYFDGTVGDTIYAIRTSADSGSTWRNILSAKHDGDVEVGFGDFNASQNLFVGENLTVDENFILGSSTDISNLTMYTNPTGNPACCGVMDDMTWGCTAGVCS